MNEPIAENLYVTIQVNLQKLEEIERNYPTLFKIDKSHIMQDYKITVYLFDNRFRIDDVYIPLLEDDPFKSLYLGVIAGLFVASVPSSEKKTDAECQRFWQNMIQNRFSLILAVINRHPAFFMVKKELLQWVFSEDTMKMYQAMETLHELKSCS